MEPPVYTWAVSKIRGTVRNGVVVLDQPVALPEGTPVVVDIPDEVSSLEWLGRFIGIWRDDPGIDAWFSEWPNSRTVSEGPTL
jgi:hypothetical protein